MGIFEISFTDTEAFRTFIYAGDMKLLYFLMILMLMDILSGVGKAIKNGELRSRKSLFGFARKIFIFFIIILANIIDQILGLSGGLVVLILFSYIANEGLSIVENCAQMNILVPKEVAEKLSVIKSTKSEIKEDLKNDFVGNSKEPDKK